MDYTPLEHSLIAALCTATGYLCGDLYAGAAFGAALFIGRELAQSEQRTIQSNYNNRRADAPWYVSFLPTQWDTASILDMICPIATVILISLLYW